MGVCQMSVENDAEDVVDPCVASPSSPTCSPERQHNNLATGQLFDETFPAPHLQRSAGTIIQSFRRKPRLRRCTRQRAMVRNVQPWPPLSKPRSSVPQRQSHAIRRHGMSHITQPYTHSSSLPSTFPPPSPTHPSHSPHPRIPLPSPPSVLPPPPSGVTPVATKTYLFDP